nr:DUF4437 domain-containing protein [Saccharopolyspora pogona]
MIQEDDYIWHGAELIGGEGPASERRLSVDEEDGSSSLRIDFHTDWGAARVSTTPTPSTTCSPAP